MADTPKTRLAFVIAGNDGQFDLFRLSTHASDRKFRYVTQESRLQGLDPADYELIHVGTYQPWHQRIIDYWMCRSGHFQHFDIG